MGRPRINAEEKEEETVVEEKVFTVLDSNGKVFRVVKTEEEANELIKIVSGRLKR